MRKNLKNKKWYSIIVIVLIIWFLIVLTTWVFKLIFNEMKDNKVLWDYIKTYAWAESWQELALLWIKKVWYPYVVDLAKNKDILQDCSWVNERICTKVSFKNDWKQKKYEWSIPKEETVMVPLFYLDLDKDLKGTKLDNFEFSWRDWSDVSEVSWNIVSTTGWISWVWEFNADTFWNYVKQEDGKTSHEKEKIYNFLRSSKIEEPYLILVNTWKSDLIYSIVSNSSEFISPELKIVSSWEVNNFKTNLETKINLADLNALSKYSIFSP